MPITWSARLAVGVPVLDGQHQELFRRIAALLESMAAGRGRAHLMDTLDFLDTYVVEHFTAETSMMRKAGYPHLQSHLGAHAHFVAEMRRIRLQIDRDEIETRTVVRAGALFCDWLREHIATSDRDFGTFLTERAAGQAAATPFPAGTAGAASPDDGKPSAPTTPTG
jgi:hemerythrin